MTKFCVGQKVAWERSMGIADQGVIVTPPLGSYPPRSGQEGFVWVEWKNYATKRTMQPMFMPTESLVAL